MTVQEKILQLLDGTDRQGIDEVMDWLRGSGFFTAPASTNFQSIDQGNCFITIQKGAVATAPFHVF